MSKLDEILDDKVKDVAEPELKMDGKTVKDGSMTENLTTKSDNAQKEEGVKEAPTHDKSGKLLLTNDHMHNMGMNLHGTMLAVKHMQDHLQKLISHAERHTKQTQLHEQVLHQLIKKYK